MASVDQLLLKLDKFEMQLKSSMPEFVREMAGVVLSYTITAIRRNGGLIGNPTYSNNPGVPAYLYKGKNSDYPKALNAAGRRYINAKIKEGQKFSDSIKNKRKKAPIVIDGKPGFINWKGLRNAQGLQVERVDLTYSGRMFQNIFVIDNKIMGTLYQAVLGGQDTETINKLRWNYARYGNFLKPPQIALDFGHKRLNDRINQLYLKIMSE